MTKNACIQPEQSNNVTGLLVATLAVTCGASIAMHNVAICAVILGFLLVLRWPVAIAVGLYAVLIPFESVAVIGEGNSSGTTLAWIAGAGAGCVLLLVGMLEGRLQPVPPMAWWWLAFVIWAAMTYFWSVDAAASYARIPTALSLLALYIVAVCFRMRETELKAIVTLTIMGGVVAALLSMYQFLSGAGSIGGRGTLTSEDRQADPNFFAAALVLPLSLSIAGFLDEGSRVRKLMMIVSAATITVAIFLTMSRGALVAITVTGLVFAYRTRFRWRVVAAIAVLGSAALLMPELFVDRLKNAVASGGEGRVYIWIAGLKALKQYFVLGAGLNGFPWAYRDYAGFAPVFRGSMRASHNSYLGASVELGIIGLGLLLIAILAHLKSISRLYRTSKADIRTVGFEAAAWGIMAAGFFVDLLWRKEFWLVWVFVVYAYVNSRSRKVCLRQVKSKPWAHLRITQARSNLPPVM